MKEKRLEDFYLKTGYTQVCRGKLLFNQQHIDYNNEMLLGALIGHGIEKRKYICGFTFLKRISLR